MTEVRFCQVGGVIHGVNFASGVIRWSFMGCFRKWHPMVIHGVVSQRTSNRGFGGAFMGCFRKKANGSRVWCASFCVSSRAQGGSYLVSYLAVPAALAAWSRVGRQGVENFPYPRRADSLLDDGPAQPRQSPTLGMGQQQSPSLAVMLTPRAVAAAASARTAHPARTDRVAGAPGKCG